MEAAFIPEVNGELDTQNFEKFEKGENQITSSTKSGPWRKVSKNIGLRSAISTMINICCVDYATWDLAIGSYSVNLVLQYMKFT
ncbi:hypothetical protein HanRHA438_Chr13g0621801 [Helianthus annuus]|nr:hypothetical protein HanRHA438_Chr13g0621801 [Helianthus annuus]